MMNKVMPPITKVNDGLYAGNMTQRMNLPVTTKASELVICAWNFLSSQSISDL